MKSTREIALNANKISWQNPEAKKKSLSKGREKLYKARREAGEPSFKKYHLKSLQIGKLKQYNNLLGLHLIKAGITNTTKLLTLTKRLNTPKYYRSNESFTKAITVFVEMVKKEKENVLTYGIALELINRTLESKEIKKVQKKQ